MEESDEAGRFLVASRDIQKGEVLKILNFDDDDDDDVDMARYMTEWPKMCLTYLTYLMCLRI